MRGFNPDITEPEDNEIAAAEIKECEYDKRESTHFASTYTLKPNEQYEVNNYSYETDRYGRIQRCKGTLRLEDGKRNPDHQVRAGGEFRLENDEGGHLIARRFGGSEKIDNIVPMDSHVNRIEYKGIEDEWAKELEKGNIVDVKIRCKYEEDSMRPTAFIVKSKVTEQNGFERNETHILNNSKQEGGL